MPTTPEQRQVLKQKWQKAHDVAMKMAAPDSFSLFQYHHTKNNIDVRYIKATSESESDATIIRGDVIVEKATAQEFMNPYVTVDMKIQLQTDPNTRRVEVIEEWTDEEGHWQIKYYVISAGGLCFLLVMI